MSSSENSTLASNVDSIGQHSWADFSTSRTSPNNIAPPTAYHTPLDISVPKAFTPCKASNDRPHHQPLPLVDQAEQHFSDLAWPWLQEFENYNPLIDPDSASYITESSIFEQFLVGSPRLEEHVTEPEDEFSAYESTRPATDSLLSNPWNASTNLRSALGVPSDIPTWPLDDSLVFTKLKSQSPLSGMKFRNEQSQTAIHPLSEMDDEHSRFRGRRRPLLLNGRKKVSSCVIFVKTNCLIMETGTLGRRDEKPYDPRRPTT
jgi:hypothetical protein